jgi:hypothetical protein
MRIQQITGKAPKADTPRIMMLLEGATLGVGTMALSTTCFTGVERDSLKCSAVRLVSAAVPAIGVSPNSTLLVLVDSREIFNIWPDKL